MFDAPYCKSCGEKEDKNGEGCKNPNCELFYKRNILSFANAKKNKIYTKTEVRDENHS